MLLQDALDWWLNVDDDDDIDSDLPGPSLLPFKLSHFLRQNNVLVIVQDAAINGDVDVRMLKLDEFLIFHRLS